MNEQQRAVVQQALDALEVVWREHQAIDGLRQLLEQPEPVQEPQTFLHWYANAHWGNEDFKDGCHRSWNAAIKYATPPAQPAAWVGLDGLEMSDLWLDTPFDDCTEETFEAGRAFIEAIEAKLKEKNT
jgi:hypothetical protein